MNVQQRIADILRRLRGIKANRITRMSQINVFTQSWSQELTLSGLRVATFEVTIVCAGAPIADVSYAGFDSTGLGIIPSLTSWSISGNTAVAQCEFTNTGLLSKTITATLTAWALNGVSASFRRLN